jgi:hypothetical protein
MSAGWKLVFYPSFLVALQTVTCEDAACCRQDGNSELESIASELDHNLALTVRFVAPEFLELQ